jgi:hypothetical protein
VANTVLTGCTNTSAIKTMDRRLEQLVTEAKQYPPQSEERQKALIQLVDEILRSRKICRYGSQPLSGVYQEIYQQLQQQLLHDLERELDKYKPECCSSIREWANWLRSSAFREVLNDTQLKKLALEAKQHPPNTESRQQALIELVNGIVLSGRLCRPHRWILPPNFYELIYEEAVNQTLVYVCQKIDTYKPYDSKKGLETRFITWVNFRLDKMVLKYYTKLKKQSCPEIPTLADLEDIAQPEPQVSFSEMLRQCLEDDAKNLFKSEHIRNCPKANFRDIALATISGKSWEEISTELEIKIPTLSSFFQRSCKKFASEFREYL